MTRSAQRPTPRQGSVLAALDPFFTAVGGKLEAKVRSGLGSGRRLRPCGLWLVAALLAAAPAAVAQPWTPLGTEFQVNASTTGHQWTPSVASDAAGNFVVVWSGEGLGDPDGIVGRTFQASGEPSVLEFWVNYEIAGYQQEASVGSADNGDFVVVWGDSNGGVKDIRGQRFSSGGSRVDSNFLVNSALTLDETRGKVAVLPDGRFIVVWSAFEPLVPLAGAPAGEDPVESDVVGRRFASDGTGVGSEFQVNTYSTGLQRDPAISATSDGGFVVAWTGERQGGDYTEVLAQRFDSVGGKLGSEFQVNTYTTNLQYSASIAVTDDDGFVVAWASKYQDGDYRGVFGQRYDSNGVQAGSEFQVNAYGTGLQGQPAILASSGGGFLVAWEDGDIWAKLYGRGGTPVSGEFVLNTYLPGLQSDPALSGDAGGPFVVTWMSFGQDGDGLGIFGQRFMGPIFLDGFESGDLSAWSTTTAP